MSDHPPLQTLRRFGEGLLQPDDMATVAIHVAGCEPCRKRANREEETDRPYAGAIRRVARRATEREARFNRQRRRAPSDLAQILALPIDEWNRAVRSSPRYHSYAFARQVLSASKAGWTDDPYRSERLAELGLFVADRLSNAEHGRRNLNDLRSRAWAYIGNCRRIQTNHSIVPDAFAVAIELHHAGSGAARDLMQLVSFLRSFASERGHFEEALELLGEVNSLASHCQDSHERGRALWAYGRIRIGQGEPGDGVAYLRDAHRHLREHRERGSTVRIRQALADCLVKAGSPEAALSVLEAIAPHELALLGELDRIRQRWTMAHIYRQIGDSVRAACVLAELRDAMSELRIAADAAMLALDLAEVHLDLGDSEAAAAATLSAFPALALLGLGKLSLAALDLFRRAGGLS